MGCELAVLAMISIICIFLFPVAQGPYSAIHGPVTALQAIRSAARVKLSMIAAALSRLNSPRGFLTRVRYNSLQISDSEILQAGQLGAILRC
jgi:hypothetical protein